MNLADGRKSSLFLTKGFVSRNSLGPYTKKEGLRTSQWLYQGG